MVATKTSKPRKGKARDSDLAYAAELVRRYREKDPYRVEMPDGRILERFVDGDELANELQRFAAFGTWDETAQVRYLRLRNMRAILRAAFAVYAPLIAARKITKTRAIGEIVNHYGVSEDNVKDALRPRIKRQI